MSDFKRLRAWRKSHQLAIDTVKACATIRGSGATVVKNQLVRSIISVPANIAEGSAKQSDREFARFLRISLGSLTESEYYLILARDLELIPTTKFDSLNEDLEAVRKMMAGLVKWLARQSQTGKTKAARASGDG
jgi:four helix bundle protein